MQPLRHSQRLCRTLRRAGLGMGKELKFVPEVTGTRYQIKAAEITKIYNYYNQHGELPLGNKIFR